MTLTHYAEDDGTFNDDFSPATLYGGTWSLKWNTQYIFMSSEGGTSSQVRTAGVQPDQIQSHQHRINRNGETSDYSISAVAGAQARSILDATSADTSNNMVANTMIDDGTGGTPRKGTFTHPRNRLIRYYQKDA